MAGTPPMYGNARWGGPQGIRIPYEMTKSAMMVKKEVDLGTMAGTTITLDPSQAAASYITATPTANSIIYFPAVNEGLPVVITNLASATYTLTVGVTGNATTVSVAANSTAIIVHDKASGGVLLAGGSTGGSNLGNTAITGTLSVSGVTTFSAFGPQTMSLTALTTNGAIGPHTSAHYIITKAGVLADTLAAPTATTDDGLIIDIVSSTAYAHTVTATGLLGTGSASVNVATFAAYAGAGMRLMAYQGKWLVLSSVGITFS
jgi:hypothetical protein